MASKNQQGLPKIRGCETINPQHINILGNDAQPEYREKQIYTGKEHDYQE